MVVCKLETNLNNYVLYKVVNVTVHSVDLFIIRIILYYL